MHSPEEVVRQAQEGRLEEWVHDFLQHEGGNRPLSDGLRLQPRFWIGPVLVPLPLLQRCCGPEPEMEYVMDAGRWEQRVAPMAAAMDQGWAPPPLIAQYRPDGVFSLRDGNHRYEALTRAGRSAYWCVVWCDSEELRREALAKVAAVRLGMG